MLDQADSIPFLAASVPLVAYAAQLAASGMDVLLPSLDRPERPQKLSRAAPQRADLRAVVLVGDLAGAVVELELLQRREGAIAFFLEHDSLLLPRPRLLEAVAVGSRLAQKRPGHEQHAGDSEQGAQHEPDAHYVFLGEYFDGHFVTSESFFATKTPFL